jgi:hypothetical protein
VGRDYFLLLRSLSTYAYILRGKIEDVLRSRPLLMPSPAPSRASRRNFPALDLEALVHSAAHAINHKHRKGIRSPSQSAFHLRLKRLTSSRYNEALEKQGAVPNW